MFYDIIYLLISIFYLPAYLFKKKNRVSLRLRLSPWPRVLNLNRPIWIHAVSVGETITAKALIEKLRLEFPGKKFVISTVTITGNKIARELAREGDFVCYLPLDFSFLVKSALRKISPSLFIIMETEIWPNLITCLYKNRVPIVMVNGRISEDSFRGYSFIKMLIRPVLNKVNLFCLQGDADKQRLLYLGVKPDKIRVTGNMKFDGQAFIAEGKTDSIRREKLGIGEQDKIFVAGSTHPGEEEFIIMAYKRLLPQFPNLKLIIAPRHPERAKEVSGIISGAGFRTVLSSGLDDATCVTCLTNPIFVLDTIGELLSFYRLADIVFVGGSLVKKGGHNILEPASLEKPVIFGPYMYNFKDIAESFIQDKACIQINDIEKLESVVKDLLDNPYKAAELGRLARQAFLKNQGATAKNVELIRKCLNAK